MNRRLVITVCERERGTVKLPVERGGPAERLDARALASALERLVTMRGLEASVTIERACAGGCAGSGPNVSVRFCPVPPPGELADHVAIAWKAYVTSIQNLPCLAAIVDDNLERSRALRGAGAPQRAGDSRRSRALRGAGAPQRAGDYRMLGSATSRARTRRLDAT